MNGKYAKYIKNFVKSFKVNGENLEIYTDKTPKDKPLVYEANQQNIELCNQKLDTEYQIITDNEEKIKQEENANGNTAGIALIIFFILTIILSALIPATEAALSTAINICMVIFGFTTGAVAIVLGTKCAKFEELTKIIKEYKKYRKNIEKTMEEDPNITKHLSEDTHKLLEEKKDLVKKGYSSEILDIDFMDKLLDKKSKGRRELITLLNTYKAIISLNQEPTYIKPFSEKEIKPKSRTKNRKQKQK